MYFNSSFAFGLRPLASFIGEGHLVFVAGVVSLALCDLVLMDELISFCVVLHRLRAAPC